VDYLLGAVQLSQQVGVCLEESFQQVEFQVVGLVDQARLRILVVDYLEEVLQNLQVMVCLVEVQQDQKFLQILQLVYSQLQLEIKNHILAHHLLVDFLELKLQLLAHNPVEDYLERAVQHQRLK
jgi:hypothetical protein